MRRRSYVPGQEAKPGNDQVPLWQPNEPAKGSRQETDDGQVMSGISLPGQRQLRSRPAFVPQPDRLPPQIGEHQLPDPPQNPVAVERPDVSAADRQSPTSSRSPASSNQSMVASWWRKLRARLTSRPLSATTPPSVEPGLTADRIGIVPTSVVSAPSETRSTADVIRTETAARLPAWLSPDSETADIPVSMPVRLANLSDSDPAAVDDPPTLTSALDLRWRTSWSRGLARLNSLRTRLRPALWASWRREQAALSSRLRQWLASGERQFRQIRAARAARHPNSVAKLGTRQTSTMSPAPSSARALPEGTVDQLAMPDVPSRFTAISESTLATSTTASPSSQLPGAPAPAPGKPIPGEAPFASGILKVLRRRLRAAAMVLSQRLSTLRWKAQALLRRRAGVVLAVTLSLAVFYLVGRSQRIRRMLDPDPPVVELLVAGPVIRDAVNNTLKVPLRIVLDDDDLDSIDQELINDIQISYGETAELTDRPLGVRTLDDSGDPLTRVIEVTLPGDLAGRQVMLQAATSRRQDQVRLSFAAPPAFEIRQLGPKSSEYYDELGLLRLEVDGSIKEDDGRYDYEWLVTTTDASGHTTNFTLPGSQGELLLMFDASQHCSEYTVTLLARSDAGSSVSWSQERRACRQP